MHYAIQIKTSLSWAFARQSALSVHGILVVFGSKVQSHHSASIEHNYRVPDEIRCT